MKTPLQNPVDYDIAINDLNKAGLPQASLMLAINLLRDARDMAHRKLQDKIERENKAKQKRIYA